jgi:hypothetical protein
VVCMQWGHSLWVQRWPLLVQVRPAAWLHACSTTRDPTIQWVCRGVSAAKRMCRGGHAEVHMHMQGWATVSGICTGGVAAPLAAGVCIDGCLPA